MPNMTEEAVRKAILEDAIRARMGDKAYAKRLQRMAVNQETYGTPDPTIGDMWDRRFKELTGNDVPITLRGGR